MAAQPLRAEVRLSTLFSEGAVLQRGMAVPIWGSADPGESVTVSYREKQFKTVADSVGQWLIKLGPLDSGEGADLTASGKNTVTVHNIAVGEVWIASGQSNMAFSLSVGLNDPVYGAKAKETVAGAKDPLLRMFTVARKASPDQCWGNLPGPEGTWKAANPENAPGFSAVAYHFAKELRAKLKVPVGIVNASVGGTPAEAWTSRETLEANPLLKAYYERWAQRLAKYPDDLKRYEEVTLAEWQKAAGQAKAEGKPIPRKPGSPQGPDSPYRPATCFNAMLNPVIPYAIRGAIWYQGEGNSGEAPLYKVLFPSMIGDWRSRWGQGDFPFLFVQLANYQAVQTQPSEGGWGPIREAQLMTLSTPNTGMACAIDLADPENPSDIHPHNKQEVGRRLSLVALAKVYNKKLPSYSGPIYSGMKIEGNQVRLSFKHSEGGLTARGDALKGFAVAGRDQQFHWADARVEGESVMVSSGEVPEPVAVRYGWASNPIGNLYNKDGLPASPFRTDTDSEK